MRNGSSDVTNVMTLIRQTFNDFDDIRVSKFSLLSVVVVFVIITFILSRATKPTSTKLGTKQA